MYITYDCNPNKIFRAEWTSPKLESIFVKFGITFQILFPFNKFVWGECRNFVKLFKMKHPK